MAITYRSVKGSALTSDEVDANFQTLVNADSTLQTNIDAKENALGFTPVPDTRTINGHDLTADVTVSKSDVGLSNVDNTSDANKPVSTAQATALATKQNSLGYTAENSANKDTDGTLSANSDTKYPSQKAVKTYVDLRALDTAVVHNTGNETVGGNKNLTGITNIGGSLTMLDDAGILRTIKITAGGDIYTV